MNKILLIFLVVAIGFSAYYLVSQFTEPESLTEARSLYNESVQSWIDGINCGNYEYKANDYKDGIIGFNEEAQQKLTLAIQTC